MGCISIGSRDISPVTGVPKADTVNEIIRAVNVLRKISFGGGLTVSCGASGVSFLGQQLAHVASIPRAWDATIQDGKIVCTNGLFLRGSVSHFYEPMEAELPDVEGDATAYVSAVIDTTDNTAVIAAGNLADVTDAELNISSTLVKIPLYLLSKKAGGAWGIVCDYRTGITGVVYA